MNNVRDKSFTQTFLDFFLDQKLSFEEPLDDIDATL